MKKQISIRFLMLFFGLFVSIQTFAYQDASRYITFVYSSDPHYGITRTFRGKENQSSSKVNRAMIDVMNRLQELSIPDDGGVMSGKRVGAIDFVINAGDFANRMEPGVLTATRSWKQFKKDWYRHLKLRTSTGKRAPLFLLPGNHDISNAIGHFKIENSKTDNWPMVQLYNQMIKPKTPLTTANYSYHRNPVNYSFNYRGFHFAFVGMWVGKNARKWLNNDLVDNMPTLLFTHDQPEVQTKHLINPNGNHSINATNRFENLVDTASVATIKEEPVAECRELAAFLKKHPMIKAYFHGNSNYNECYQWNGPDGDINLSVIRVDSPMKGKYTENDESKLSFQLVVIDTKTRQMTVRECLWNQGPRMVWGDNFTIQL